MGPGVSLRAAASSPGWNLGTRAIEPGGRVAARRTAPERAQAPYPKPLARLWGEAFVLAY